MGSIKNIIAISNFEFGTHWTSNIELLFILGFFDDAKLNWRLPMTRLFRKK